MVKQEQKLFPMEIRREVEIVDRNDELYHGGW
jgi:hypothetical protein